MIFQLYPKMLRGC